MKATTLLTALFVGTVALVRAQYNMNIHQNDGTVLQIPISTIDSITHSIDLGDLATLVANNIMDVTTNSAVVECDITDDGGTPITARGSCWSYTPNPTVNNFTSSDGTGAGTFSSTLNGLAPITTVYVRAYATNSAGTAYSNEMTFTTLAISNPGGGVLFDNYNYSSIVLGNGQEWMAENLRSHIYANGDPIIHVTDSVEWIASSTGAWKDYNNDSQYENPYGSLYNWYAAADPRNACPTGWHVPVETEMNNLVSYLLGVMEAGGRLKITDTLYWASPNTGATNEVGFSAFPSGRINTTGASAGMGTDATFWTSTATSDINAGVLNLRHTWAVASYYNIPKLAGCSIRCLRD